MADRHVPRPLLADPREWPRLPGDRFRTPPRSRAIDDESDLVQWQRRDRVERIVSVVAVAFAMAILIAILGLIVYSLAVFFRPDEGWNSSYIPTGLIIAGCFMLILLINLGCNYLAIRKTRRELGLDSWRDSSFDEHDRTP
jgi:hypothetical protein